MILQIKSKLDGGSDKNTVVVFADKLGQYPDAGMRPGAPALE